MAQSKRKPDCEHFRGMATNTDVCQYYVQEDEYLGIIAHCRKKYLNNDPDDCPTNGLRFKPRADSDDNGEVE